MIIIDKFVVEKERFVCSMEDLLHLLPLLSRKTHLIDNCRAVTKLSAPPKLFEYVVARQISDKRYNLRN